MSYAVVVNLDYESHSEEVCQELWDSIKKAMLEAGFRLDNRVFMINREDKVAGELARDVIEGMEAHLDFDNKHIFRYLKDFYGYSMEHTTNLLIPSNEEILISKKSEF